MPSSPTSQHLDGLLGVARLVRDDRPLAEVHTAMADAVCRSLGYRTAVISRYRPAYDDFRVEAVSGDPAARAHLLGVTSRHEEWAPLLGDEHERRGAYFIPAGTPRTTLPGYVPDRGDAARTDRDAWDPEDALIVPLCASSGELLGMLSVDEPLDRRRPSDAGCQALAAFAANIALAVETRMRTAARQRHAVALARLATVAAEATRSERPAQSLRAVARAISDTLGFELVDAAEAGDDQLRGVSAPSAPLEALTPASLEALLERCPSEDGCHVIPAEEAPVSWGDLRGGGRGPCGWTATALLVPLRGPGGALLGALMAARPADDEAPDAMTRQLLRSFAVQSEAALSSAAAAALARAEARSGAIVQAALDAVVTIDSDGIVTEFNPSAERTFGFPREHIVGRDGGELLLPAPLRQRYRRALAGELRAADSSGVLGRRVEVSLRRANGEVFAAEMAVARTDGDQDGRPLFTAWLRDISARVAAREELERERDRARHAALHDARTGLPNRAAVEAHLGAELDGGRHALALRVSLRDFGLVNESLGHAQGDTVLRAVGTRLQRLVGPDGFVARLDGDEFLVLLDAAPDAQAAAAAVHEVLAAPFGVAGVEVHIEAIIGAAWSAAASGPAEVLRHTDIAVSTARGAARPTGLFRAEDDRAANRLALANGLRGAIQTGELELHYQPLHGLESGRLAGFEALVRWRRDGRLVPPAEFIPFAEASGLIEPLGAWVVDAACRQIGAWRAEGAEIVVGLNISPRQLRRTDLVGQIAEALERHGAPAAGLCVELTETALRTELAQVRATLTALGELGVRCAIDDFGADYSSLSRLRELPVEMVKIDRSFLTGVPGDERGAQLLAAIQQLAAALELRTVVEGIETPEQLELTRRLGCDLGQGYLLGRPAPADEATATLASHRTAERLMHAAPAPAG